MMNREREREDLRSEVQVEVELMAAELVAANSAVTDQRIGGRERAAVELEGGRGERTTPQW